MLRLIAFAAVTAFMTIAAMLIATATQSGKAEAGDASERCQTITIQPDAGYGVGATRQIRVCK
ncbi:MAG: hypothetical protein AB7F96_17480 [Beijerinckiaceae bacterium]